MSLFSLSESDRPCLIVGGDSLIGCELGRVWNKAGIRFLSTTRRRDKAATNRPYPNLADESWGAVSEQQYASVVLCAGVTGNDDCEKNPTATRLVNVTGLSALVSALENRCSSILFISSTQVFDGLKPHRRVLDMPSPITEYGRQKLAGEEIILGSTKGAVLRITKVLHSEWNLIRLWRSKLRDNISIEAYTDCHFSPVTPEQVVNRINLLLKLNARGVWHLSGDPEISYFDFAKGIAEQLRKPRLLVKGIECSDLNPPKFASLLEDRRSADHCVRTSC